jgi:hypothetical protein
MGLVFTASLVISARLLWIQHEGKPVDVAALDHSKRLLKKTETIFQNLDYGNSLVLSCWKYIHQLSVMCNLRGKSQSSVYDK